MRETSWILLPERPALSELTLNCVSRYLLTRAWKRIFSFTALHSVVEPPKKDTVKSGFLNRNEGKIYPFSSVRNIEGIFSLIQDLS